jgi:hypothetical protein
LYNIGEISEFKSCEEIEKTREEEEYENEN